MATLGIADAEKASLERRVAQVVVEHGTMPMADLYFELKPLSRNPEGTFDLFRIGDAVHSRNIHAGIYDAMRYGGAFLGELPREV